MKTYTLSDIENYPVYHKELWTWLAQNPEKSKEEWFKEFWKENNYPTELCFGCEITKIADENNHQEPQENICDEFCGFSGGSNQCCFGLYYSYLRARMRMSKIQKLSIALYGHQDANLKTQNQLRRSISENAELIANLNCDWMYGEING